MNQQHTFKHYYESIMKAIISSGLIRFCLTPLDVLKCKLQINPNYSQSLFSGIQKLRSKGQLMKGCLPILIGYSGYNFINYFLFKQIKESLNSHFNKNQKYDKIKKIYYFSFFTAQLIATIFLCPFESLKLKMQLSQHSILNNIRTLYVGLIPLLIRNITYNIFKISIFYNVKYRFVYNSIIKRRVQDQQFKTKLMINFVSAFITGSCLAFFTHPIDTIFSQICYKSNGIYSTFQKQYSKKRVKQSIFIFKQIGFKGLWSGLKIRMILSGIVFATQWSSFYIIFKKYNIRMPTINLLS